MDALLSNFQKIIVWLIQLLPESPFKALDDSPIEPYIQAVNWIVPVDFMISALEAWLTAIALYYVWQAALRWMRAIE